VTKSSETFLAEAKKQQIPGKNAFEMSASNNFTFQGSVARHMKDTQWVGKWVAKMSVTARTRTGVDSILLL